MLLTFAMAALLEALKPGRGRTAARAGALVALSLAISIENIPFILAATAALGLVWVARGAAAAPALRAFAAGLVPAAAVLFLATVPPELRTAEICDAFGAAHLVAVVAGGCLLAICSGLPLTGVPARAVAGVTAGAAVLALLHVTYPACLGDPFVGMPPLMREVWLNNVGEAMPLWRIVAHDPWSGPALIVPPVLALIGLAILFSRARDAVERSQHLLLMLQCGIGLVASVWMIRAESSLAAPVIVAGAVLAVRVARRVPSGAGRLMPWLLPLVVALPASSAAWAAMIPPAAPAEEAASTSGTPATTCTRPRDLQALAALPPMRLLTTLDAGAFILAETPHGVIAGPYHRNRDGDVAALRTFLAAPDEAAGIARASGARHLAFCAAQSEVGVLADRAPNGLAAQLRDGKIPSWLARPVRAGPWTIYEID